MKKDDAKKYIVASFLKLPENERTENKAVQLSFEYSGNDSPFPFRGSADSHQVIMGWLSPYIYKKY